MGVVVVARSVFGCCYGGCSVMVVLITSGSKCFFCLSYVTVTQTSVLDMRVRFRRNLEVACVSAIACG